jgi:hypothetical protein
LNRSANARLIDGAQTAPVRPPPFEILYTVKRGLQSATQAAPNALTRPSIQGSPNKKQAQFARSTPAACRGPCRNSSGQESTAVDRQRVGPMPNIGSPARLRIHRAQPSRIDALLTLPSNARLSELNAAPRGRPILAIRQGR